MGRDIYCKGRTEYLMDPGEEDQQDMTGSELRNWKALRTKLLSSRFFSWATCSLVCKHTYFILSLANKPFMIQSSEWPMSLSTNMGSKKHLRDSIPNHQNGESDPAVVRCLISYS